MRSAGKFLRYWLPVLVWMSLMLSASTNAGAPRYTSRILNPLLQWLFPAMPAETRVVITIGIRKAAHLTEYAVLALLVWRALRHRKDSPAAGWNGRVAFAAVAFAAAFASTDEFFQTFWSERSGSPKDVALDTFGAALGMGLLWLAGRWRGKW
ncbi:MAG TPA: VanZ family protein, partial [Verrucomicrobiae bacterium]